MKKIKLRKILLHYSFRQHNEEKKGWAYINSIKRPSYKEATALLKRSLHSKPATGSGIAEVRA